MSAPIEFVASDEPVEPLPPPRPPRPHRWLIRILALAVVLAAGITWIATRPTARPSVPHANRAVPSILNDEPYRQLRCYNGAPIPAQVIATVNRYLRRTTVQQPLTTRCIRSDGTDRRIVAEAVIVNAAGYNLRIALSAPDAQFPPMAELDRASVLGRIETEAAGVRVQLIATGFAGSRAPMARLQHLADDLSLGTALPQPANVTAGVVQEQQCHVVPDCSVDSAIPGAAAVAIEKALGSRPLSGITVRTITQTNSLTLTQELVRRDFRVTEGSVSVLIRVQRGGPKHTAIGPDPLGVDSLLISGNVSGYTVRLQYLAPETLPPALGRLRALLHDPRLESL